MKPTLLLPLFATTLLFSACQKNATETTMLDSTQVITTPTVKVATGKTAATDITTFFEQQIKKSYPTASITAIDAIKISFEAINATDKTIGSVCQWESPKGDVFTVFTYSINNGKISLDKNNLNAFDPQGNNISALALDWTLINTELQTQLKEAPKRGFMSMLF